MTRHPRPRRAARPLRWALLAVTFSLLLSSCAVLPFLPSNDDQGSSAGGSVAVTPSTSQKPPTGSTGLARFYAQQLTWSRCTGGQCTKLTVPIDYAHPSTGSIQIAVIKVPAKNSSRRLGSLVFDPGGPGASGVDFVSQGIDQVASSAVRSSYDVVGFDPRGVARSAPIDCVGDRQLDTFLGMDPTPDTPAEEQSLVAADKAFGESCAAHNPTTIAHVSTVDAAKDMDVLRAALGDTKLNYIGKSYGTLLGATYAELFPTTVGRMVLDGVEAPDLTAAQLVIGQAQGFERATRAYVESCVTKSDCPVGQNVDDGMQWIRDFLSGLDSQPIRVTDDQYVTELTESWAASGIAQAMYDQSLWSVLSEAFTDAKNGDGNLLMRLADALAERTPGGQYTGNLQESIYAVNCLDRPDTADITQVEANVAAAEQVAPTWGKLLAWGGVTCGEWPVKPVTTPHRISAQGAPPIVVVGTTRDPATPYEWSVRLRQQLAKASLITYDGDGHTAYLRSNSCVNDPIDAFFLRGTVPTDGLKC